MLAGELTLEIVLHSIFGNDLERLERQLGANPFEVVAKEQNRDLKFAFRFRSLTKLVAELIARRRREPEEHVDFLSMLMAARDRDNHTAMSDKELIDEVMTLIVAGHETTAAALTWTWYLVARHPDVAAEAHACTRSSHETRVGAYTFARRRWVSTPVVDARILMTRLTGGSTSVRSFSQLRPAVTSANSGPHTEQLRAWAWKPSSRLPASTPSSASLTRLSNS